MCDLFVVFFSNATAHVMNQLYAVGDSLLIFFAKASKTNKTAAH
jgi:hypothetical protein